MALANELTDFGVNVILRSGPEFLSKFIGESEERVRSTFKEAFNKMPSVIIIDKIDSLIPKHPSEVESRLISQVAVSFDEIHQKHAHVVVIGVTNNLNAINPELVCSGKFDTNIKLSMPDLSARIEIFRILFKRSPLSKDVWLNEIAKLTDGYTGADMKALIDEAGAVVIKRGEPLVITKNDILEALKTMGKIVGKKEK